MRIELPEEVIEAIAQRAAELVLERSPGSREVPALMSVNEAAEYMRCERQRIYNLRSAGKLSRLSDGTRALVRRDELDAHLADDELSRRRVRRRVA